MKLQHMEKFLNHSEVQVGDSSFRYICSKLKSIFKIKCLFGVVYFIQQAYYRYEVLFINVHETDSRK